MGKIRGPFSSNFTGKVGNVVGRKGYDGEYVISAYQPAVANPNTDAQVSVRSKFKLLSQLAASIGTRYLIPYKGYAKTLRGGFFKRNFPAVTVSASGASLTFADFQLSPASAIISPLGKYTLSGGILNIALNNGWDSLADWAGFLVYVNNRFFNPAQMFVRNVPVADVTSNSIVLSNIPYLEGLSDIFVGVWIVGYVIPEDAQAIISSMSSDPDAGVFQNTIDESTLLNAVEYGTTSNIPMDEEEGEE